MKLRPSAAALATVAIALGSAGCTNRQVSDVPDDDRPTPETTPFLEPVSPPAEPADDFEDVEEREDGEDSERIEDPEA